MRSNCRMKSICTDGGIDLGLLLPSTQAPNEVAVPVALTESLLAKLGEVCVAGVQSLARHSDQPVKEGGFLHRAAAWAKNQVLTLQLDIKR